MDCFASLAMTWSSRHAFTASPRMRPSLWLNPFCALLRPSLRAKGSRERAPDDRLREAIRRPRRHCERSEAIHLATARKNGLLRCARNDVELQARPRFTGSPAGPALPAVLRDDTPPTDCLRSTEAPAPRCGSDRTRMDTWCGSGIRWAG